MTLVAELEPNTAVGACSDETVVDFPRTKAAPELAWSIDHPVELDYSDHLWASWRRVVGIGAVIVAAAALVAGGIIAWNRYGQRPSTAASPAPAPAKPPAWHLNGTYRIDINSPEAVTYRSDGTREIGSESRDPARSSWVAFRTECELAGCTAHSVTLDDVTHQNAALDEAGHKVDRLFRWNGAEWESAEGGIHGGHNVSLECDDTSRADTMEVWAILSPLPDGSFRGTRHGFVMTNECGTRPGSSTKYEIPMTAVRIGDAPPGVFE
jgi:hypothetical protein